MATSVREAMLDLLNYTGGWDLEDEDHPIMKARRALEAAAALGDVELHMTPAEAAKLFDLADVDHDVNGDQVSKSAAKKIRRQIYADRKANP